MKAFKSKSGKIVFNYLKEIDETFQFHRLRLSHAVNEEDIHYMRRAIKRYKALLKLFDFIQPSFESKKIFKPVRNIFESAGTLREIQMNRNILGKYNPSPALTENYAQFMKAKKKSSEKELKKTIKKFSTSKHKKALKRVEKLCRKISHEEIINSTSAFLNNRNHQVRNYLSVNINEQNLHSVRILFKTISPSLMILDVVDKMNSQKEIIIKYKNVEDKLGYWHDRIILQESLKNFLMQNSFDLKATSDIQKLIQELETENKLLFNEALQLIGQLMNKPIEPVIASSDNL